MKVALVYDRVNKWGGAERVLLALHELFPEAPLYTSVYNKKTAAWADNFVVKPSFLQNFPMASSSHEWFAMMMPTAFESFSFDEYDLVISVTSEAAKGIITKPSTKHICYCLTPTRYLWSGYDEYFRDGFFQALSRPAINYLRKWDKMAAARPDAFVAISEEVKGRVKKFYNREAGIVYPPIDLHERYKDVEARVEDTGYFLLVSRLVSYKKIELAIQAFNELRLPLKVIGSGYDKYALRALAGDTIEFLSDLTDKELVGYYKSCKALVFPGHEDFGLVMAEAQSFGKPVIAFRGGGALEIVNDGKTGLLFHPQTAEALLQKIVEFDRLQINPKDCIQHVGKFSKKQFKKNFMAVIDKVIG